MNNQYFKMKKNFKTKRDPKNGYLKNNFSIQEM